MGDFSESWQEENPKEILIVLGSIEGHLVVLCFLLYSRY